MSEELSNESESAEQPPPPEPGFRHIIEALAVPALVWTGHLRHPGDPEAKPDLSLARYQIGLLEILEQKTRGNLDKDDEEYLADMLHSVRLAYIRASDAIERSQAPSPSMSPAQPAPKEEISPDEKQHGPGGAEKGEKME